MLFVSKMHGETNIKVGRTVFSIMSYTLKSLLKIRTEQWFTKVCGSNSWGGGFNAKYEKCGALVSPVFYYIRRIRK
jgi:hypothetical protein